MDKSTNPNLFDHQINMVFKMKESIADFRETYDVESPGDLVIELEPGNEGWSHVGQWQSTRRYCAIVSCYLRRRSTPTGRGRRVTNAGNRVDTSLS